MVDNTWANIRFFLYQLDSKIRRLGRRLIQPNLFIYIIFFEQRNMLRHQYIFVVLLIVYQQFKKTIYLKKKKRSFLDNDLGKNKLWTIKKRQNKTKEIFLLGSSLWFKYWNKGNVFVFLTRFFETNRNSSSWEFSSIFLVVEDFLNLFKIYIKIIRHFLPEGSPSAWVIVKEIMKLFFQ